jgi:predicted heme/steroid binding protein
MLLAKKKHRFNDLDILHPDSLIAFAALLRLDFEKIRRRDDLRPLKLPEMIAVWENEGNSGSFYTASAPTISYKNESGQWKDGGSFSRHDLLDLAEASREAASKIRDLMKSRTESLTR